MNTLPDHILQCLTKTGTLTTQANGNRKINFLKIFGLGFFAILLFQSNSISLNDASRPRINKTAYTAVNYKGSIEISPNYSWEINDPLFKKYRSFAKSQEKIYSIDAGVILAAFIAATSSSDQPFTILDPLKIGEVNPGFAKQITKLSKTVHNSMHNLKDPSRDEFIEHTASHFENPFQFELKMNKILLYYNL